MHNNYIVIEGLEGAGKTTACNTVFNTLKELGISKIISTSEPGGTQIGEKIRNLILDVKSIRNEMLNDKAEMLMFYAARVQLMENVIKPALAIGNWIISDRNNLSTHAYQGGGRGIDQKILEMMNNIISCDFSPGLTIYLDVKPEIGLARVVNTRKKLDRIEQESLAFFNRTRNRYIELVAQDPSISVIDAMQSLEIVTYTVRNTVIQWFKKQKI